MRFLNKVVFINSATIRYAEVMLDGNVHLIGTQGVGKSTLLRAILFFYNADTLKLGISREKKSFAEYYFPYQNSYLIYEVVRETGPFCILAFKSQGKVCFRFLDGAYSRAHFVSEDGMAFEKWEDSRRILDAEGIGYTRKVDRYEEYRDVVYGNLETGRKEFAKYSLLQSRQYQNIPRTIQNVLLNSKLEAEFIKQTIIMSLNEDDIFIDLQSYTHHLKNFESQLNDIQLYQQPHVQKQAGEVVKNHLAIKHLESEKNKFAMQLVWSAANFSRSIPRLADKKEKIENEKAALLEKEANAKARFITKTDKIKAEVNVLDSDLKKVKEKTDYYHAQKIEDVIARASHKAGYEAEKQSLLREKQLLTTAFEGITQKYDGLLTNLKQSGRAIEQENKEQQMALREAASVEKESLRAQLEKTIADIKLSHKENIQQARVTFQHQQDLLQQERIKKASITHKRFFEAELAEAVNRVNEYKLAIQEGKLELGRLKDKTETLQKQWELDESSVKQATEREQEKIQASVAVKQRAAADIKEKIQVNGKAFYGWLSTNKPGWEDTIGKVVNDAVLFNASLSPKIAGKANSFFGIELDLTDIPVTVKTMEQYADELNSLLTQIEQHEQQVAATQTQLGQQLEKLKKKYQPQLKQTKDSLLEKQYKLEQDTQQLQHTLLALKDWEIKANDARQEAQVTADAAIAKANEALLTAQQVLQHTEDELNGQLKNKEREHTKKTNAVDQHLLQETTKLNDFLKQHQASWQQQTAQLEKRRLEELAGKGADTLRIEAIDKKLREVDNELLFIESKRELLTAYKIDRKELIDRSGEFKARKAALEHQLEQELEKNRVQAEIIQANIRDVDEKLQQVASQITTADENQKAFARFQQTEAWFSIDAAYTQEKEAYKNERSCHDSINDIDHCYYTAITRLDSLKETATKFVGNFSAQNIFNFPQVITDKHQYRQFAEDLNEFINDSKIEEFEKRVNDRFANVIKLVGKETADLMSRAGDIQKVITNINKDFDSKNFVGAIRKIELRINDSANSVVQLLLKIKQYNDEHSFDIGGLNLFSTVDRESTNKKAVDLLKQLSKAITEYRRDVIALSDSFELQFRVEENENDTGWVEKLSNVGSEGTDVLVKAMINIMLLNVFKEGASKRFREFRLHCMMDEIGKLHPNNIKGILQFANDRNILLINGSPTETNALNYRHIYKLEKDSNRATKIKRIITNNSKS